MTSNPEAVLKLLCKVWYCERGEGFSVLSGKCYLENCDSQKKWGRLRVNH